MGMGETKLMRVQKKLDNIGPTRHFQMELGGAQRDLEVPLRPCQFISIDASTSGSTSYLRAWNTPGAPQNEPR